LSKKRQICFFLKTFSQLGAYFKRHLQLVKPWKEEQNTATFFFTVSMSMWPPRDLCFDNYKTTHFKFKYLVPERYEKSEGWSLYQVIFWPILWCSQKWPSSRKGFSQIWLFAICEFF
jgi:hypothetical protein